MSDDKHEGTWSIEQLSLGVTELKRTDIKHITYLTETPQVHIHYFMDDASLAKNGWGFADLCCHGCAAGLRVVYPNFDDAEVHPQTGIAAIERERRSFVDEHRGCPNFGGEMLCPPHYHIGKDGGPARRPRHEGAAMSELRLPPPSTTFSRRSRN